MARQAYEWVISHATLVTMGILITAIAIPNDMTAGMVAGALIVAATER
jgi:hypothetical protein